MLRFWLIRHGETKLNNVTDTSQDRIRGWSNIALDDRGREVAAKTGKQLLGHAIAVLFTSDLIRADETAHIIAKIIKVPVITLKEARPWNLGNLTGTSTKEAIPKLKYYVEHPDEPVPEGEAFNTFTHRGLSAPIICQDRAQGKRFGIVTHHRIERLYKAWIAAGQPPSRDIDLNTFLQKGEDPGKAEQITMNEETLRKMYRETPRQTIKRSITGLKEHTL